MSKKRRYIVMRDAFNDAFTVDTKPIRTRRRRLKLIRVWDAFECIPEIVRKAGK